MFFGVVCAVMLVWGHIKNHLADEELERKKLRRRERRERERRLSKKRGKNMKLYARIMKRL